ARLTGEELLEHLRATPATEYLVVEDTGEIYGVLSTRDVERAFLDAMARPSPSSPRRPGSGYGLSWGSCPNRPVPPAAAGPSRSGTRSSSPIPRAATTRSRSRRARASTLTREPSPTTS